MTDNKLVASLSASLMVTLSHTHVRASILYNLLLISDFGLVIDFHYVFRSELFSVALYLLTFPSPQTLGPNTLPLLCYQPFATLVNKWVNFGLGVTGRGAGCSCDAGATQTDYVSQQSITVRRIGVNIILRRVC